MEHILLIEDEPNLLLLLARFLRDAGYEVSQAANGADGLRQAMDSPCDLVILDLMLPDLSGEEILETLVRSRPNIPVLVLSSVTETARRVRVLDSGAIDFVAKPFAIAELLARLRTRLRPHTVDHPGPGNCLRGFGLELDVELHELRLHGRRVCLSQREFLLLAHLLRRAPQTCTRQELWAEVWGMGFDPGSNVVDVYVRRLRSKLPDEQIETVRNVGYRLVAC